MEARPNPKPEEGVFQLGLCMAGAVSAGAYTAGVLDFLIEALDTWEEERGKPGVPAHRVRLRALSGASAGGMCAAILLAVLGRRFPPARDAASRARNPLWQAWVEGPSIEALLDPSDLGPDGTLRSVLNVGVLQRIVDGVLDFEGEPAARPWVAASLPMMLSLGNLRGVPYGMALGGADGARERTPSHRMRMHADQARFLLGGPDAGRPDFVGLATSPSSGDPAWREMGLAALATGAFPLFLEARGLSRKGADYVARKLVVPGDNHPDSAHRDSRIESLAPDWPQGVVPDPYRFLTVDGGVFDNEPLDLCRALMMDAPGQRLVRDGRYADRTVLMVDPFPDATVPGPEAAEPLHVVALALVDAWKMQCRFGAVDAALAAANDVYSRMMIQPSGGDEPRPGGPLAAGGLGAFLGFFHREFRRHDFELGRRNCQRFLRLHFALPQENPLFGGDPAAFAPADSDHAEDLAKRWRRRDVAGDDIEHPHIPVIPLFGACAVPEPAPRWPAGELDPKSLAVPINERMKAVADALLREAPLGWAGRAAARTYWAWKRADLREGLLARIDKALKDKGLA